MKSFFTVFLFLTSSIAYSGHDKCEILNGEEHQEITLYFDSEANDGQGELKGMTMVSGGVLSSFDEIKALPIRFQNESVNFKAANFTGVKYLKNGNFEIAALVLHIFKNNKNVAEGTLTLTTGGEVSVHNVHCEHES